MRTALVLIFSFAGLAVASELKPPEVKRLVSVTWDMETHKLLWTVQKGFMVGNEFVPSSEMKYEISPDEATMLVAEESRGFDQQEAVSLHRLLDTLSLYCAERVVWWDRGEGVPADQGTHTAKPTRPPVKKAEPSKNGSDPVKVRERERKPPKREYHVPDNQMVAMSRGQ